MQQMELRLILSPVSDTTQVCRLGSASAGTYPVMVSFPSLGDSRYAGGNMFNFTYQLIVSSFSPLSGSVAGQTLNKVRSVTHAAAFLPKCSSFTGGTLLTVRGFGFSENTTVTVGGGGCTVVHASDTELKCRTPAVREQ